MVKKQFGDYTYTDKELEEMFKKATENGEKALRLEPRAKTARYDKRTNRLVIELINGTTLMIPSRLIQGLSDAEPEDIAKVKLTPYGLGLHWKKLDADFSVAGLLSGIFGTKVWMSELGRRGGSASSEAKAAAARANGKKGGRPKTKAISAKTGT